MCPSLKQYFLFCIFLLQWKLSISRSFKLGKSLHSLHWCLIQETFFESQIAGSISSAEFLSFTAFSWWLNYCSAIFTNSQYLHDIDSSEQDHKYHALIWYSLEDNFQKYFWIFLTKQIKGIFDCQFHKSDSSPLFWTKLIFYNLSHIFKGLTRETLSFS